MTLDRVLSEMPLVAILRGMTPAEAPATADALQGAGFLCAEVPLNSPDPLASITAMRQRHDGKMFVGAGTVLSVADVARAADAGAQFIVAPNTNAAVIAEAKRRKLAAMPGFLTPTEAFAALDAGADALKLFPGEQATPAYVRALRAVLKAPLFVVGGVTEALIAPYLAVGATGFGLGSNLYRPGDAADKVATKAAAFVTAFNEAKSKA